MARRIDRQVINGVIYKWCGRCHKYHPESEFNICSAASDYLQGYCRRCNVHYCKEWHTENDGKQRRE